MSDQSSGGTKQYPDCAGCGDPVQYDQARAYYEHEDTGEVLHVGCYEEYVDTGTEREGST